MKKNAKQQYTHHVRLNSNYIIACLFVHGGQRKSEIVILYYVYTCFRRCCKKKKKNIDFVVYFSMTLFIHFFWFVSLVNECENDDLRDNYRVTQHVTK